MRAYGLADLASSFIPKGPEIEIVRHPRGIYASSIKPGKEQASLDTCRATGLPIRRDTRLAFISGGPERIATAFVSSLWDLDSVGYKFTYTIFQLH